MLISNSLHRFILKFFHFECINCVEWDFSWKSFGFLQIPLILWNHFSNLTGELRGEIIFNICHHWIASLLTQRLEPPLPVKSEIYLERYRGNIRQRGSDERNGNENLPRTVQSRSVDFPTTVPITRWKGNLGRPAMQFWTLGSCFSPWFLIGCQDTDGQS